MRCLITGASGFIGRHLVAALLARGERVRCLVRSEGAKQAMEAMGAEGMVGDVTEPRSLAGVAEGVTYVFHLAAQGHVSAVSKKAWQRFWAVNVEGTRNVLEACSGGSLQRFVHFSSTAAMGLPPVPLVSEETPCQPSSAYQRSKREAELVVLNAWRQSGLPAVVVRPCMVYGPGGTGEFLRICRLVRSGVFPRVSRGRELTPAVCVSDLVSGALAAADRGRPGQVYLLTGPASYEMHELRRLVLLALNVRRPYPYVPLPLAVVGAGLLEVLGRVSGRVPLVTPANILSTAHDRVFDISKAQTDLGYEPHVAFADGVAQTVAWYKEAGLL